MIKILYAVTIFIGFASTAYAIRCHVCSSAKQTDCIDPFIAGETYANNCNMIQNPFNTLNGTVIAKIGRVPNGTATGCLKLELEAGKEIVTNRLCYWGDPSDAKEGCKLTQRLLSGPIKQKSCDVCTKDLCNNSTTTGVFAATVTCLVVLLRMMS